MTPLAGPVSVQVADLPGCSLVGRVEEIAGGPFSFLVVTVHDREAVPEQLLNVDAVCMRAIHELLGKLLEGAP